MVWTDEQIKNHKEMADLLEKIVQEVFPLIWKQGFQKSGLKMNQPWQDDSRQGLFSSFRL